MSRFRVLAVGAALTLLAVMTQPPAGASHSWENFHWARAANPLTLEVVDSVVGEWDSYLPAVVADWTQSSVIDLTQVGGGGSVGSGDSIVERTACLPIAGKVRVCNAHYPNPIFLGLATVWLRGDHIVQATAQVNDTWFDTPLFDDPNAKRHVLCQEVGHDFGLDHTYESPTCMDDENGLFDPAYISPNAHDYEQLETIYAHLDTATGGGGGNGKKPPKGGNGHGNSGSCNNGSCGSEVYFWEEGDLLVVQFVLLSPAQPVE